MACTLETAISFEPPPFCLPPFIDRKDPAAFFPLGPAAARIDRTSCFLRWDSDLSTKSREISWEIVLWLAPVSDHKTNKHTRAVES